MVSFKARLMTWTLIIGLLSQSPLGWSQGGDVLKLKPGQVAYRRMDVVLVLVPAGTRFSKLLCSDRSLTCPVDPAVAYKAILDPGQLDLLAPYNIVDGNALSVGNPDNYYVLGEPRTKGSDGKMLPSFALFIPLDALTPSAKGFYQNKRIASFQLDWSAFSGLSGQRLNHVADFINGVMEGFPAAGVDGEEIAQVVGFTVGIVALSFSAPVLAAGIGGAMGAQWAIHTLSQSGAALKKAANATSAEGAREMGRQASATVKQEVCTLMAAVVAGGGTKKIFDCAKPLATASAPKTSEASTPTEVGKKSAASKSSSAGTDPKEVEPSIIEVEGPSRMNGMSEKGRPEISSGGSKAKEAAAAPAKPAAKPTEVKDIQANFTANSKSYEVSTWTVTQKPVPAAGTEGAFTRVSVEAKAFSSDGTEATFIKTMEILPDGKTRAPEKAGWRNPDAPSDLNNSWSSGPDQIMTQALRQVSAAVKGDRKVLEETATSSGSRELSQTTKKSISVRKLNTAQFPPESDIGRFERAYQGAETELELLIGKSAKNGDGKATFKASGQGVTESSYEVKEWMVYHVGSSTGPRISPPRLVLDVSAVETTTGREFQFSKYLVFDMENRKIVDSPADPGWRLGYQQVEGGPEVIREVVVRNVLDINPFKLSSDATGFDPIELQYGFEGSRPLSKKVQIIENEYHFKARGDGGRQAKRLGTLESLRREFNAELKKAAIEAKANFNAGEHKIVDDLQYTFDLKTQTLRIDTQWIGPESLEPIPVTYSYNWKIDSEGRLSLSNFRSTNENFGVDHFGKVVRKPEAKFAELVAAQKEVADGRKELQDGLGDQARYLVGKGEFTVQSSHPGYIDVSVRKVSRGEEGSTRSGASPVLNSSLLEPLKGALQPLNNKSFELLSSSSSGSPTPIVLSRVSLRVRSDGTVFAKVKASQGVGTQEHFVADYEFKKGADGTYSLDSSHPNEPPWEVSAAFNRTIEVEVPELIKTAVNTEGAVPSLEKNDFLDVQVLFDHTKLREAKMQQRLGEAKSIAATTPGQAIRNVQLDESGFKQSVSQVLSAKSKGQSRGKNAEAIEVVLNNLSLQPVASEKPSLTFQVPFKGRATQGGGTPYSFETIEAKQWVTDRFKTSFPGTNPVVRVKGNNIELTFEGPDCTKLWNAVRNVEIQ